MGRTCAVISCWLTVGPFYHFSRPFKEKEIPWKWCPANYPYTFVGLIIDVKLIFVVSEVMSII